MTSGDACHTGKKMKQILLVQAHSQAGQTGSNGQFYAIFYISSPL